MEKISVLLSIVLISLLAISAVSAAEDISATDDSDLATVQEVQAIDDTQTIDEINNGNDDATVNAASDLGDSNVNDEVVVSEELSDVVVPKNATKNAKFALGANQLKEGEPSSFTQLAEDISSGSFSGTYYKYTDADSAYVGGITLNDGLTLTGDGVTIDGNKLARIFIIPEGASVTISGLTLVNGSSADGGAIYSSGTLNANNVKFLNNTATFSGGAIYANGGEITLASCVFDGNDITDVSTNNNTGGAAIYAKNSDVSLTESFVTNNGDKTLDRNQGDLVDGIINLQNSNAIIGSTLFENNTGIYGGAINAKGDGTNTLKVSNSEFKTNKAYNGAGINTNNIILNVSSSNFTNNLVIGPGSPGYYSSGAAIAADGNGSVEVTSSNFTANSAHDGGAITANLNEGCAVTISGSNFTGNIADNKGGAIFANSYVATVSGSNFTGNTAQNGSAIYNGGNLGLSENTVNGEGVGIESAGSLTAGAKAVVTVDQFDHRMSDEVVLTATLTDDNGNKIYVPTFKFKVNGNTVTGVYDEASGTYSATFIAATFNSWPTGITNVSIGEPTVQDITAAEINYFRTFTDLEYDIAHVKTTGFSAYSLNLKGNYTFDSRFDRDELKDGVAITHDMTISGGNAVKDIILDGNNQARIFRVIRGNALNLNNVIMKNGFADNGGAVYVEEGATLKNGAAARFGAFINNTAADNGGAIYTVGGQILLNHMVFDGNDVINLESSAKENKGGAVIYAKDAQVNLTNATVTNNGRKELDRSNGDMINGVINLLNTSANIKGGLFENNTGIYGGAILADGDGTQTLTVTNATFNNNKAYNGGAIDISNMKTSVSDCNFTGNLVVGPGSSGFYSAGGAIAVDGNGSFSLSNSNFTANSATGNGGSGGAVHIGLSEDDSNITGCTFTDNTAVDMGNAIYNHGYLKLTGNTVTGDGADIETVSKIDTHEWVIVNDNQTIDVNYYDTIPIVVKITDDAGNFMRINETSLEIDLGDKWTRQTLTLNETTGFYTGNYLVDTKSGLLTPSRNTLGKYFTYTASNNLNSTYLNMAKVTPTLEIKYDNVTYPNAVIINITLTGLEGAPAISWANTSATPFKITVNGEVYKVTITKGQGNLTISGLDPNPYVINASWEGNTKYNGVEQLYDLNVKKILPTVVVTADVSEIKVGNPIIIHISVVDGENNVPGLVTVTVNKKEYPIELTEDGGFDLPIDDLPSGRYPITAHYTGDDYYNDTDYAGTALIIVKEPPINVDVTTDGDNLIINVTDENGNPKEGAVNVTVDGATTEVPLSNGSAKLPTTPGNHTVTVSTGDGSNAVTTNITVPEKTIPDEKLATKITISPLKTITYNKDTDKKNNYYLYVTLKDSNGKALAGKTLEYNIGGNSYTGVTDSNGQVKFVFTKASKGIYTISVSFSGDNEYNASFAANNITVSPQAAKIIASKKAFKVNVKTKKFTITLKNSAGKVLKNKKVSLKVKGKTYYATTNSKGKATFKITKLNKLGTFTAVIKFGDATYKTTTKKVKITVKKDKATITASKKKTFKVNVKTKKFTITLKDSAGKVLKNKKVSLKVKGKTYYATTNSKGKATFKITKLNKLGTFTAVIKFGDASYKTVTKKSKIKVIWGTVKKGSNDKAMVKKIQRALKNNGYYLSYKGRYLMVDGLYYRHTKRAVKQFQKSRNLKVTGSVDYITAKKLKII